MTTIDELQRKVEDQADLLEGLARRLSAFTQQQERTRLEALLSDGIPLRMGALPDGADVGVAGATEPGQENLLADGSVVSDTIAAGALDSITKFADTIRPPVVVSSLPTLPSASYPAGSIVFLTTDKKLYKTETGAAWVAVVNTTDLTGTITETQIDDGAISTPKLAANAVTAAKIAAGTITATEIATDTITAGQIAAGAIGASEIAANAVTAAKIAAGTITVTQMAGDPRNLVPNPGGEAATVSGQTTLAGWTLGAGLAMRLGSLMRSGNAVFQYAAPDTAANQTITDYLPIEGGRRYRARAWVGGYGSNSGTGSFTFKVSWYTQAQALISSTPINENTVIGTSATFVERVATVTAPTTAVYARVWVSAGTPITVGDRFYADDFELTLADQDIDHASGDVLIKSDGITITNGKLTVTNASATVIIDGSSNMFKIAASGSLSVTASAGASNSSSATLTGLGALATVPAHLSFVSGTNATTGQRNVGAWFEAITSATYVALSSGGSPTQLATSTRTYSAVDTALDGSSQCVVRLFAMNGGYGTSQDFYAYYHVLKEAAL